MKNYQSERFLIKLIQNNQVQIAILRIRCMSSIVIKTDFQSYAIVLIKPPENIQLVGTK